MLRTAHHWQICTPPTIVGLTTLHHSIGGNSCALRRSSSSWAFWCSTLSTRGSFSQLVLGLFIALLFAVVQMQVQPYKRRTDNFLATASNVSLFSFFICAALYRVVELTSEFDAVSAQLTGEWASRRFTVSFQFISAVMLISLFGGLILMVVLHLIELFVPRNEEVFRWALNSSEVVPPTLKAGQFHTFLSHNWASGQECVQHKRRTSLVCVLWPSI